MKPRRATDVPGILARHGIDPDADADTLKAALEAQGWSVTVEETGIGRARRSTAHATRVRDATGPGAFPIVRKSVRATGLTPQAALAFVLAKVLKKEGGA